MSFTYITKDDGENAKPVFTKLSAKIAQGSMVVVTGPQGEGKNTLLKLIGQVLVPDSGTVFVPPHLRVLHVSADAYFVNVSLKSNLFYGLGRKGISEKEWDRGALIFFP